MFLRLLRSGERIFLRQNVARMFSTTHSTNHLTFVTSNKSLTKCEYRPGQTVLDVAKENDIDIEGACGGKAACSTCHVILSKEAFEMFREPDDDELDTLTLAPGLTNTSRLGCQMVLEEEHDGLILQLPDETVNILCK